MLCALPYCLHMLLAAAAFRAFRRRVWFSLLRLRERLLPALLPLFAMPLFAAALIAVLPPPCCWWCSHDASHAVTPSCRACRYAMMPPLPLFICDAMLLLMLHRFQSPLFFSIDYAIFCSRHSPRQPLPAILRFLLLYFLDCHWPLFLLHFSSFSLLTRFMHWGIDFLAAAIVYGHYFAIIRWCHADTARFSRAVDAWWFLRFTLSFLWYFALLFFFFFAITPLFFLRLDAAIRCHAFFRHYCCFFVAYAMLPLDFHTFHFLIFFASSHADYALFRCHCCLFLYFLALSLTLCAAASGRYAISPYFAAARYVTPLRQRLSPPLLLRCRAAAAIRLGLYAIITPRACRAYAIAILLPPRFRLRHGCLLSPCSWCHYFRRFEAAIKFFQLITLLISIIASLCALICHTRYIFRRCHISHVTHLLCFLLMLLFTLSRCWWWYAFAAFDFFSLFDAYMPFRLSLFSLHAFGFRCHAALVISLLFHFRWYFLRFAFFCRYSDICRYCQIFGIMSRRRRTFSIFITSFSQQPLFIFAAAFFSCWYFDISYIRIFACLSCHFRYFLLFSCWLFSRFFFCCRASMPDYFAFRFLLRYFILIFSPYFSFLRMLFLRRL